VVAAGAKAVRGTFDDALATCGTTVAHEMQEEHRRARSPKILLIYIQYSKTSEVNSL